MNYGLEYDLQQTSYHIQDALSWLDSIREDSLDLEHAEVLRSLKLRMEMDINDISYWMEQINEA